MIIFFLLLALVGILYWSHKEVVNKPIPKNKREIQKIISSIIEWSEANIKLGKKRKIRPLWRTLNIKASIYCGTYESSTKVITIYLKNNPDIKTLVDTCIHEYIHHLQIRGNVDCIRYNKQTNLKGYWENDYETEARILAKKYTNQCIKDLKL